MPYQIDQSNKIETTTKDTILGLANDHSYAIIIKRQTKRKIQHEFRRLGKSRLFVYRTFIAGVVMLIKFARPQKSATITIDTEYFGLEPLLNSIFHEMAQKILQPIPTIIFHQIGKKSEAHRISYLTSTGKLAANRELSYQDLKKLVFNKKTRILKRRLATTVRHPRV